jgi:hypothetical protein
MLFRNLTMNLGQVEYIGNGLVVKEAKAHPGL